MSIRRGAFGQSGKGHYVESPKGVRGWPGCPAASIDATFAGVDGNARPCLNRVTESYSYENLAGIDGTWTLPIQPGTINGPLCQYSLPVADYGATLTVNYHSGVADCSNPSPSNHTLTSIRAGIWKKSHRLAYLILSFTPITERYIFSIYGSTAADAFLQELFPGSKQLGRTINNSLICGVDPLGGDQPNVACCAGTVIVRETP